MKYAVKSEFNSEFENVKKIVLGSGKLFYVYRDDAPYVSAEVNLINSEFFTDSIIIGDYLLIGNYYDGVYVIDLLDLTFKTIEVDGYFGSFVEGNDCIYILGCENIIAINSDSNIVWKSDDLAVDGIVFDRIDQEIMYISCEIDPPGGWIDKKIDLSTGKVMDS